MSAKLQFFCFIAGIHLFSDILSDSLLLEGYMFLGKCRLTGIGGGVGIYIGNNISFKQRFDLENNLLESLCLDIFIKKF